MPCIRDSYRLPRGVKRASPRADDGFVTRAALFVLCVLALAASGWTFWHKHYELHKGGKIELLSGQKLAAFELQTAAHTMAEAKASTGTFAMTDLRTFKNLAIVYATDSSYCLQVGVGAGAMHYVGPAGPPITGPC